MTKAIKPTKFQQAVLQFRSLCGIINAGGRGSGKSFTLLLDLLGHCRDFDELARPLVMRESAGGLQELMSEAYSLCTSAFGRVMMNKNAGTLELSTGGIITFACVSDEATYAKLQGRSFTALYADEVGNYSPTGFSFMLKTLSNLRVPPGRRPSIHITANPHGRAHSQVYKNWITKAPPWHPFIDGNGLTWIWTTSTLKDNPHIDQLSYERNLRAACGQDEALADAWINGDWSVLGGVMFSTFDPKIHIIKYPPYFEAKYRIGGDWGSAAPSVAILLGQLKEQCGHLKFGDIIALDETDTADPGCLSSGNGAPPGMFAEMIKEMAARNGCKKTPALVMDDARGLQGDTVVNIMRENRLSCHRPYKKDRIGTWVLINQLLHNAKTGEGMGLWFTNRCQNLISTLPCAPRGTLRAEDIDPKWQEDHWIDSIGYGLQDIIGTKVTSGRVKGVYY